MIDIDSASNAIIRGIMPNNKGRLHHAKEYLEPNYFTGSYVFLWALICGISKVTGGEVADTSAINRAIDADGNLSVEQKESIRLLWLSISSLPAVSDVDFKLSIDILRNRFRDVKIENALVEAHQTLTNGTTKGKVLYKGADDALNQLRRSLETVDKLSLAPLPEGYISSFSDELTTSLYADGGNLKRINTGFYELDDITNGGVGLGELWLVLAYGGTGKTTTCVNMAYNMFIAGKNVVYFTAETLAEQITHNLAVRHSRHEKFGLPTGLSSTAIKKYNRDSSTLTREEVKTWHDVVHDLSDSKTNGYGNFYIAGVELHGKMSTIHSKLEKISAEMDIDAVFIDSLDILRPEVSRSTEREELNQVIAYAKHLAITFNGGQGLRIISPWQSNTTGWKEAKEKGGYSKSAMGETVEALRKSDLILSLLDREDSNKLKAQLLKFRDSAESSFDLDTSRDNYYIGSSYRGYGSVEDNLLSLE